MWGRSWLHARLKACEALAAEYTRRYVDITSIPDDDPDEERFGERDRARMTKAAAEMVGGGSSDDDEDRDEVGGMSDVD